MHRIYLKPNGDSRNDVYYETEKYDSAGGVSFYPKALMAWRDNKLVDVLDPNFDRVFVHYNNIKQIVKMKEQ